ncbi:hypothetical protein FQA39_LY08033 [Lamprigera yunnana]|nr:hypothetical protein FQA39_LY08033 [Lamprigera yunnana]
MAAQRENIINLDKTVFGVSELKQKIKNLRCTYNQECLKVQKSTKSGAGADDIYISNIKWFDAFNKIMKSAKGGKSRRLCDRSPAAGKRRKLENLTQAVQQLRELSINIQDSSNNEHEAFGNFVAATLNNLGKADAQHEIQGVLFKYRLANVDASKHSSFQEPNSKKNTQTTHSYLYNNSLQSPYSNHSIDGYPHQQYSENTNSTFYSNKHTNAPQQTNIERQSLNLDATSLANEHTNDDSVTSQALRFI